MHACNLCVTEIQCKEMCLRDKRKHRGNFYNHIAAFGAVSRRPLLYHEMVPLAERHQESICEPSAFAPRGEACTGWRRESEQGRKPPVPTPSFLQDGWIQYVLFYAIGANLPFWYAHWAAGMLPLGWMCLEYLLVGLAGLWLPTGITVALMLLAIIADVVSAISGTFYLTPLECIQFSGSLTNLAIRRIVLLSMALLLIAISLSMVALLSVRCNSVAARRRAALGLCVLAVCIGLFDLAASRVDALASKQGGPPLAHKERFRRYDSLWLGRYTVARLWREQRSLNVPSWVSTSASAQGTSMGHASSFATAAVGIETAMPAATRPNLVVVLVESWGTESDAAVRDRITKPYREADLLKKYEVRQGTVPFRGGTIGGEMRELCGSTLGLRVLGMNQQKLQHCLPSKLDFLGYRSTAVHGMSGSMFDRVHWWPRMGFQQVWFRDRLAAAGLPLCKGPYIGICDDAIASWMIPRLQTRELEPQFLYWVTLNSHLPISLATDVAGAPACDTEENLRAYPELCSWSKLIWRVHYSVAHLAMQTLARPTVFLLVGDHAPPFGNAEIRNQFSSAEVPYLLLTPR